MNTRTKTISFLGVVAILLVIIAFSSCEKYVWDPPVYVPPDTTQPWDTVYYSEDIAPLFPEHNCTMCHSGGIAPDLRLDKSFDALTNPDNSFVYYDKQADPAETPMDCRLIKQIQTGHNGGMPAGDVDLIADWIAHGAKNYTRSK